MSFLRILFALLLFTQFTVAQNLQLFAPIVQDTCGTTVDMPVRVKNFKKIVAMQGTVGWNTAACTYNSISSYGSATIGLASSNFGYSYTNTGKIVFSWSDASLNGKTLTDSTILFTIRLNVTGNNGSVSDFKFYNSPTPIEFVDSNLNTLTVDTFSGKVNIFCNSCNISSITAGTRSSCDFFTNTYTQPLTITYANAPSTGYLRVNNQDFSITSSPQTVTLANLNSNGSSVNVTAFFTADTACKKTVNNLFVAPSACRLVTLYTAPISDTCFTTADVVCKVNGFTKIISAQGSLNWDTARLSFLSISNYGTSLSGLNSGNFGTSYTTNGKLTFSWNDVTQAGKTLNDSTALFTVRFLVKSGNGNTTLNFTNSPTTLEFVDSLFHPVSVSNQGGFVNVYCANNCSISNIAVGSQSNCNAYTNSFDQTLVVTYSNAPAIGNLVVNGQSFAITGSPQTVVLTNLLSNGAAVNISAYFGVNPACNYYASNAFTAPVTCRRVQLFAPVINDTCFTTCDVPVKVKLFHKIISMQGSIGWDTSAASYNSISNFGPSGLGMATSNFGYALTSSGKLTFSWNDPSLNGVTLADSTVLFVLRLNLKPALQSRIRIFSNPTALEFVDTSYTSLPVDTIGGRIAISCTNSCSISAIGAGSQGSCDTTTNTFSQQLQITYGNAPSTGFLVVNNQSFAITGSPQTVTLTGLFSDGTSRNVSAYFSALPSCALTVTNVFTAPAACKKVVLFISPLTDTCLTTVDVPVQVKGFKKMVSQQGTVVWDTAKVQYQSMVSYNSFLGINSSNIGVAFTNGGKLTFSWNDASLLGKTINDSSILFTIRFYIKANGGATGIGFSNSPVPIEFVDSSLVTQYCDTNSGQLNVFCFSCAITSQPGNVTVCAGQSATFTVGLNNSTGATYQWLKNGNTISGATASSYTISSVSTTDAGTYKVNIGGACGSLSSNNATLTVNTVPNIAAHPANATVCAGSSTTFSITASGATGYQWRKNGNTISGATSATYTINPTATTDAGNYDVIVSNNCGSVTSNAATLTVNTSPSISSHPSNITVCSGSSATFTVTASGATGYQWRKNTSNITGATSSSYTINPTTVTDAGSYDVVVTNSCGSITSNTATLTVNTGPSISSHPGNVTVCSGASATFTVTASGATGYQWRKNTSNITGATSSSYTINPTSTTDAGTYDVVVSNSCGSVTSNGATLTVNTSPGISAHPGNLTVCSGGSATFTVTASGAASYQWRKNTSNITGATSSSYTINPTAVTDAGSYDVVVTNSCGSTTSNAATLTVNTGPSISSHPGNITVCSGSSATFTVTASGATGYQWRKNTSNITGATSSSYTINPTAVTDAGTYDVVVSNSCGSITSNAATLTINTVPGISTHPGNVTVCVGASATFTVTASNATGYQWRKNTSNISGATSSTYSISSTSLTDAGTYDVVVSNSCGSITSNSATLTVNTAPSIVAHPSNVTVCAGASATFSVTASGANSYQWRKNTSNITGATSSSYTIVTTAITDAGTYDVVVTNSCGNTTSNGAVLTINTVPTISSHPTSTAVCAGSVAVFAVSAGGAATYQWRKNTTNITGATASSYTISSAAISDAGTYDVVITNSCGSNTSNGATLTVNTIPAIGTQPSNITVCAGASATFNVTATGATSYQWRKNFSNITGATTSSYTIVATSTTDIGTYDVVVTNNCGNITSNGATLTVNTVPNIVIQPSGNTICVGAGHVFSVTASGAVSYQWRKNTTNITGATASSYTIASAITNDAGTYDVVITNTCGSTTSNGAILVVNSLPLVTSQPNNITACLGGSASFAVTANNALGYQWRRNGVNINGANAASLNLSAVSYADSGDYDVRISNACGIINSNSVKLKVITAPVISTQPLNQSVCIGDSVVLRVKASDASNFQWRKNGIDITGAVDSVLRIPTAALTDAGTYTVMVSNVCGFVISNLANVNVSGIPSKPTITKTGTTLQSSSPSLNQWYRNGVLLVGAVNVTYNPIQSGYYQVKTGNGNCSALSDSFYYQHTGIKLQFTANELVIFPNPITQEQTLTIQAESTSDYVLQVFDVNSKLIFTSHFSDKIQIQAALIPHGINILRITNGQQERNYKLIRIGE